MDGPSADRNADPGLAALCGGRPEHAARGDRRAAAGADPRRAPATRGQAAGGARAGGGDARQPARPARGAPGAGDHEGRRHPPGRRARTSPRSSHSSSCRTSTSSSPRIPIALAQVLEARQVVEVGNTRLAAERITPAAIARLEEIVAELRAAVDDADRFRDLDIGFHDAVGEATGNFLLGQFMRIINTLAASAASARGQPRLPRARPARPRAHPAASGRTIPRPPGRRCTPISSMSGRRSQGGADEGQRQPSTSTPRASSVFDAICDPRALLAVIPGCEAVRADRAERVRRPNQPPSAGRRGLLSHQVRLVDMERPRAQVS